MSIIDFIMSKKKNKNKMETKMEIRKIKELELKQMLMTLQNYCIC